jgi:hypothetical protein
MAQFILDLLTMLVDFLLYRRRRRDRIMKSPRIKLNGSVPRVPYKID